MNGFTSGCEGNTPPSALAGGHGPITKEVDVPAANLPLRVGDDGGLGFMAGGVPDTPENVRDVAR